ncbi:MAG: phosphoheptose isomerase [Nitrospirae bacterium GWC2_46_6]|nr:MAG: phosphoheptose isomerase [Nitrospirae bacterium GWA2_46_11]OGW23370.1 MAG: phosphoheptose isomerase [Nitrospirae bacterium GWC2_46_6]OGW23923.1 MAG: phosphoheptose isomerase [Nitrospirae bacterium GWB2_47_37]HAK89294.1 phosphoheptose isomerase [Nitrospiraceae bacterium]HCL80932.1 phosphoheptose isomerase [Nitrospiraceae bacterium]
MEKKILKAFEDSISVKSKFVKENASLIADVSRMIADAFNDGKKLIIFGNGGSACDASHIAAEFVNRFKKDRPGLPAIALNTDMAVLTSIANDYDYAEIFARQVKTLGEQGDIAIAISTSGGSKNILKAVDAAKKKGLKTIAFTGTKGDKFASKSDYAFVVPTDDTPRIQETHITLGHVLCQMIEEILFEAPRKR